MKGLPSMFLPLLCTAWISTVAGCAATRPAGSGTGSATVPGTIFRATNQDEAAQFSTILQQMEGLGFKCARAKGSEVAQCQHSRRLNLNLELKFEPTRLIHTAGFELKEGLTCEQVLPKIQKMHMEYNHAIVSCHETGLICQSSLLLSKSGFETAEIDEYFKWWSSAVMVALGAVGFNDDLQ